MAGNRDLTGWIWATDAQVIALMGHYGPAILTADRPRRRPPSTCSRRSRSSKTIGPTFFFSGYSSTDAWVSGWTATDLLAAAPRTRTRGSPRASRSRPPPTGRTRIAGRGCGGPSTDDSRRR